ncbi:helix-turn-helix transcriptional regulator [Mariprofundus erugo]|uniref:helix-turn-helix transcriptional regulator n=1 Tax=Mariprofundus erugo TaxID=2528639 RepID=UPI001386B0AE|nr:WYL domain-containing protein [Mariprofundus erugo]
MDKFDRIYALHRMFTARRYPVSLQMLCDELACEASTVKRLIRTLREQLDAPVYNVRGEGWCYDRKRHFELPGLWFNRQELEALLAMNCLIAQIGPGLLAGEIAPIRQKLEYLLERCSPGITGQGGRIRILEMGRRTAELPHFSCVAAATLERRRVAFAYAARSSGRAELREVSPQRLVHYRDNWYLDGFCHLRQDLRTFSLDCMADVTTLETVADDLDEASLNNALASAYGIFSGHADKLAVLRFSSNRARWVASESWHPEQQGEWLENGDYELRIPYADATELILDICRYGPDVEVIAPPELRQTVALRLREAANRYA